MMKLAPALAAAGAIALALAAPIARSQDDEKDASWRTSYDKMLDRYAEYEGDRLDKLQAIVDKRLKEKPDDGAARLELARLKLVKSEFDGALIEAGKAAAAGGDVGKEAEALRKAATYLAGRARLEKAKDDASRKAAMDDMDKQLHAASEKLDAAAGSKAAGEQLFVQERDRFFRLKDLREIGQPPKPLGKPDVEGKTIDWKDYSGKVVLVHFWTTGFPPSLEDATLIGKLWKEHHKNGFEVIGINSDAHRDAFDAAVKKFGMEWRQYFDGKQRTNEVAIAWGVTALPYNVLVDHTGKVRYLKAKGEGLTAAVKELMERAGTKKGS